MLIIFFLKSCNELNYKYNALYRKHPLLCTKKQGPKTSNTLFAGLNRVNRIQLFDDIPIASCADIHDNISNIICLLLAGMS